MNVFFLPQILAAMIQKQNYIIPAPGETLGSATVWETEFYDLGI